MVALDSKSISKLNKLVDSGYSQEQVDDFISDVSEGRLSTTIIKNTEFLKIFGARMLEARDIAGYSQIAAAKKLGYSNSSRLNKIEKGIDVKLVSVLFVKNAGRVYSVSTDFLLGESRDWERNISICHGRDINNIILNEWARQSMTAAKSIAYAQKEVDKVSDSIIAITPVMAELNKAFIRFRELNPKFDNMRGGASLVGAIDRLGMSVDIAKGTFRRYQDDARNRCFSGQTSIFDVD